MILTPGQLNRRAEFYHQLGSMIASGVPLIQALEMASRSPSTGGMRKIIPAVISHLREGLTFTDSMKHIQGSLPEFDMALLSAGEQSGRLDSSLKILGENYAMRAKIIRDTIQNSLVTIATVHVLLIIAPLGLWIQFVLGIVNHQYAQCLPFIIEKVLVFGSLYGIILFLIYACQGNRGHKWRSLVDTIFDCVPILRTARRYLVLSRFAAALEALLAAGVSVIRSWQLAGAASGSQRVMDGIERLAPELERGLTPAEMVAQIRYFPEMFVNLYTTGEHTGKIDETLARLQAYFQEEGFRKLQVFSEIVNRAIYFIVAGVVGYFVIHFWVSYYTNLVNSF